MSLSTSRALQRSGGRKALVLPTLLAVATAPLALGLGVPAQAASTGLVISEVFGANGAAAAYNQDYIEILNPTGAPISTAGMSVQYRSAAGPNTSSKVDLPDAVIPAGSTFLVGGASTAPTTAATITPDASNGSMNLSGTGGVVVLLNSQTQPFSLPAGTDPTLFPAAVVDLVGYGTTPNVYETSRAPAPTTTGTPPKPVLNRVHADTDNNLADFATAATGTPQPCECSAPDGLKITEVYADGDQGAPGYDHDYVEVQNTGTSSVPLTGRNITLQYRAPGDTGPAAVLATMSGTLQAGAYDVFQLTGTDGNGIAVPGVDQTGTLDLAAAGGTLAIVKGTAPYALGTGAVARDQYLGDVVGWGTAKAFETTAAPATGLSVTKALTRAPGGVDTDVNLDDLEAGDPNPNAAPVIPTVTIAEIQGTGPATPIARALVRTSGVVTASYPSTPGNFAGFYLQTGGSNDPAASDGIFVFMGSKASPAVGTSVEVTGKVTEFFEMTELTPSTAADVVTLATPLPAPVVATGLPGADCTITGSTTDCLSGAALEAAREKREGELVDVSAMPFTVSDAYDGTPWSQAGSRGFQMAGEIGLAANDDQPLLAPTEVASPRHEPAELAARKAYNDAHMITLDDGASVDFTASDTQAFPWFTATHTVRIGAGVDFVKPVVLDYRNDLWKLQPQGRVSGAGTDYVTFEQDRAAAPEPVGGNVKIATFNMLNYFVHPAQDWVSNAATPPLSTPGSDRTCTYYTARSTPSPAERLTANTCTWTDPRTTPPTLLSAGPRGAATATSLDRQEAKEVAAINTMDADVMSLEEVENPVKIGYADRDAALKRLVTALNADWDAQHPGEGPRWAYVETPRPEAQPTIAEQDAIRAAFIYNPRVVRTVGKSKILVNSAPFRNAREPLAQAFKRVGASRDDAFIVIVNHFKSKGSSTETGDNVDLGDGAGAFNGDRRRQAAALDAFARQLSDQLQIDPVFMTGDYNAYSNEDPILDLEAKGWHELAPDNGEKTYSFGGLAGTLDHVFANDAAVGWVTGRTVWPINANESVYYEYSRFNNNVTNLYAANPYRSSDHNPEVIGINAPLTPAGAAVDTVQVLASNDFHGRLVDDPASASAGAASMAGAVKSLRADNPDTVFSMAGDIIGASTFESFIANDKPTIDALNEAGLEVSAAGNHEFDKGYADLVERVMDPTDPEGGAAWQYLAANVRKKSDGSYALPSTSGDHSDGATWWKALPGGHTVGFVGAMTEDLPSLVAPSAIADVEITSVVEESNAAADRLKDTGCGSLDGCDLVVLLVHEGAATPSIDSVTDDSAFGRIVQGIGPDVDAIVSGHTHLSYNHKVPVPAWATEGRAVTRRPVVSAGQYGAYLNQLEFEFTPGTDDLVGIRQHVLAMKDYDADPATRDIVDAAVANAAVRGAQPLGEVAGPFLRAQRRDTATNTVVENRGGESTLGNLVAEIQRWRARADIGVMNPGGLRADLIGEGTGRGLVTYREAADVQPFANTVMTVQLTGAQLKTLLEQQWQRDPDGNVPSRPFLRLGTSKGFSFTEDATRPEGDRITGMWLHGVRIDPAASYSVAATNFLMSGGDNFRALTQGTARRDTGFTDLQATVDYLAEFANTTEGDEPLPVDFAQHGVGAEVPAGPFVTGDEVTVPVDSLSMTGSGDVQDTEVALSLGGSPLGTVPVATTLPTTPFDLAGDATVTFTVPAGVRTGTTWFTLAGVQTGTVARVPVQTLDSRDDGAVSGTAAEITAGQAGSLMATVTPTGATGTVTVLDGATEIGRGDISTADGATTTTVAIPAGTLPVGTHSLTLDYSGDDTTRPAQGTADVTVVKATGAVTATPTPASVVQDSGRSTIAVAVTAPGLTPSGTVTAFLGGTQLASAALSGGTASLVVGPFAQTGDKAIEIRYSGDGDVRAATTTVTVGVTAKPQPQPTATTVTGTADDVVWAKGGHLVATVSPAAATGTVQVYDGATRLGTGILSAGSATIALPAKSLPVGTHTLVLRYLGSSSYAPSQGTVTVTVLKQKAKG